MERNIWKHLSAGFSGKGRKGISAGTMEELSEKGYVRRHYLFDGHVQEVGFRYTALYLAGQLHLTGWVCNRADGCVEINCYLHQKNTVKHF